MQYTDIVNKERLGYFFDQLYNKYLKYIGDTDTWREIKVNETTLISSTVNTPLNLKGGTGVTVTGSGADVAFALATSGVTAGTYKRVTVDAYGRVTSGDNTDANDNTWRPIKLNGTQILAGGTSTAALDLTAGKNITLTNASGKITIDADFTDNDTNTATLKVSDTTNKRVSTAETTGSYLQFTGGANKFTVKDSNNNSFDVAITGSTGTVTNVATGVGLTGGPITSTGTIKANLNSETSLGTIGTTDKLYAVGVDANGKLAVKVPWENTQGTDTDTYRMINVNGTTKLGTATSTGAVNFTGSGATSVSYSNGTITIASANDNTTYSAGTGLALSGTTFNHSNSVTAATAGTSSATSGSTVAVPYVTYDAQGHITASGTHTHTISGFLTSHQDISGKSDKVPVKSALDDSKMLPDTMYTLGSVSSLTLDTTGTDDGYMHEWMATFTPSSSSFTFSPAVTFPSGSSITANKVNEVNIKKVGSTYYGLVAAWG